jgi:hypothetical protein
MRDARSHRIEHGTFYPTSSIQWFRLASETEVSSQTKRVWWMRIDARIHVCPCSRVGARLPDSYSRSRYLQDDVLTFQFESPQT